MFLQLLLVAVYNFQVFAGHGDVVNIECNDGEDVIARSDKNGVVSFSTCIAHQFESISDVLVPDMAALLRAIHSFQELQDHTFVLHHSRDVHLTWVRLITWLRHQGSEAESTKSDKDLDSF